MPTYSPWTWSQPHGRHYSYLLKEDGTIQETIWSGPSPITAQASAQGPSPRRMPDTSLSYSVSRHTIDKAAASGVEDNDNDTDADDDKYEIESRHGRHEILESEEAAVTTQYNAKKSDVYGLGRTDFNIPSYQRASTPNLRRSSPMFSQSPQLQPYAQPRQHFGNRYDPASTYKSQQPAQPAYPPIAPAPIQSKTSAYAGMNTYYPGPQTNRSTVASLPPDVQANIGFKDRRYIQTGDDPDYYEKFPSCCKTFTYQFLCPWSG
ncbi:hypothetical protein CC86DRAFT_76617 [Ophiobolus disseminans]|uniref:Uncharacterized protein n=1 Tax=Ophiobolus disseminans TaxID=1469910 RepID=A0A6A6ZQN2_9PLEO|nr:hypothetical protein CC86DRAFT_76617 [Ophiobolus disseminans]